MTTRKHPHDPPESEQSEASIALYQGKIAELESAVAEAKDKYLRLAADFDNYKKRMRQDQLDVGRADRAPAPSPGRPSERARPQTAGPR